MRHQSNKCFSLNYNTVVVVESVGVHLLLYCQVINSFALMLVGHKLCVNVEGHGTHTCFCWLFSPSLFLVWFKFFPVSRFCLIELVVSKLPSLCCFPTHCSQIVL